MNLSIAICTYNGSNKLISLLDSISESSKHVDIYVIDNNSSDNTKQLTLDYKEKSCLNIYYEFEFSKGLSSARNKAIDSINSDYIVFTDDDVVVDYEWIAKIENFIVNNDFGIAFGKSLMYGNRTDKLSTKESDDLEVYEFPCLPWGIGHGNNMIIKKSIINDVGYFDERLGAGTKTGSAEDLDFCYRVLKKGYRAIYSPEFIIYHNHERVDEDSYKQIRNNYAKGRGAFYFKHLCLFDIYMAKIIYWTEILPLKNKLPLLQGALGYVTQIFKK